MKRLVLIAFRNLLQHKRRTALLGAAIAVVVALLVVMTGVTNGIQTTMLRAATTLSTGHVNIGGFYKITTGDAAPVVVEYEPLTKLVREKVPNATVVDRIRGWGKVVSDTNSLQLGMGGVDVDAETALGDVLQITSGDLMNLRGNNTVLIFESQAEKLEVEVGDEITLSAPTVRGANNSLDVQVVAIAKNIGFISGFSVFVPKDVLRDIYLMDSSATGAIQIYLKNYEDADKVAETLRAAVQDAGYEIMEPEGKPFWTKFQVVTREGWTGQRLDVTTWKDELGFLTMSLDAFRGLTLALTLVLMIIVIVGVMNSMWMSIRERTQEIGTLRAIGMQRTGVGAMFVVEAATLSVMGSVLGASLGIGITALLNSLQIAIPTGAQLFLMRDTLYLVTDLPTVFLAVAFISALVTLFSLLPAVKAARMRPVTAMHHAG